MGSDELPSAETEKKESKETRVFVPISRPKPLKSEADLIVTNGRQSSTTSPMERFSIISREQPWNGMLGYYEGSDREAITRSKSKSSSQDTTSDAESRSSNLEERHDIDTETADPETTFGKGQEE